jgi:hypothetical protein
MSMLKALIEGDQSKKSLNDTDPGKHYRHEYKVRITEDDIKNGFVVVKLDPARIAKVYGMVDFMDFTVLKKILRLGRAQKSVEQDLKDIINAAQRRLEMLAEDATNSFTNVGK